VHNNDVMTVNQSINEPPYMEHCTAGSQQAHTGAYTPCKPGSKGGGLAQLVTSLVASMKLINAGPG